MSFISIQFLIFFIVVYALYWSMANKLKWQNALLAIASLVFYGWWDWRFVGLLLVTILSSYGTGIIIERSGTKITKKCVLIACIVLNVVVLGFFKYYNFFADSINDVFKAFGHNIGVVTLKVILPVGISFYTFQAIGYVVDVYRRKLKASHDVVAFTAFIAFFPQLVAGPIERATNILPQINAQRYFNYACAVDGLRQMLWGFFKKIVVANGCAACVDQVWANYNCFGSLQLIVAAVLFSMQIYADFSGYSDIAIGCGRMFGITLMRNFNNPYFATSIADFWRRWHISLMQWFRDYVYIPLGGSRCSFQKNLCNIAIVFVLSGLWHGANWTFVLWGCYHAVLMMLYRIFTSVKPSSHDTRKSIAQDFFSASIIFTLVTLGWIMFRAPNAQQAFGFMHALIANGFDFSFALGHKALLLSMLMLFVEYMHRNKDYGFQLNCNGLLHKRYARVTLYYALLIAIIYCKLTEAQPEFIYFRF